jgi:D-glycero-D-manno-heptose 1,7-bisphosphate phosphatase
MRLVILDRDGVINEDSPDFIKSASEWKPLPGSLEGIAQLTRAGFSVVVATNQSGIGRGLLDDAALAAIHGKMQAAVAAAGGRIEAIHYCPHRPEDGCVCRKPKPGLLREIAARFDTSLERVPVIGDSGRDIQAARVVGARPILVLTGSGRQTLRALEKEFGAGNVDSGVPRTPEVYESLAAAARQLVAEQI